MNWIQKLERKFGRYAIHNLMYYIIILYGVGFVISLVKPEVYYQYLAMDAGAVMHGQIWRVVTFLMQPPSSSPIFMVFALYLYYMIGQHLEATWGAFRFNLYFFTGVLFHVIAAFIAYFVTGISFPIGTAYLNLSLFFAFAAMYPDMEFLFFFVLPIKVKWLAIIDGVLFGYTIVQAFLPAYSTGIMGLITKSDAIAAGVSILNFVIFYLSSRSFKAHSPKQMHRRRQFQKDIRNANANSAAHASGAKHRCAVCGRTELDDPNLEFRYCSKCNGAYEYCQDHLFTHEHIK